MCCHVDGVYHTEEPPEFCEGLLFILLTIKELIVASTRINLNNV